MSLLTNQTNINKDSAFFLLANMSSVNSGSISTAQITTSSIGAITANVSSLTVGSGTFSSIYTDYISSGIADLQDITTSTIFATAGVFIDGAELTTLKGTDLLLNGIPIATTSNLSTLQDWAFDPAISSVNMNAFDLLNANLVSTVNLRAASAFIQNLLAWNILAVSSFTSSISSLSIQSDELVVSSVRGNTAILSNYVNTSTVESDNVTTTTLGVLKITDKSGDAAGSGAIFLNGDISIDSRSAGAGIFLTPTDVVTIGNGAGEFYGLQVGYITNVSSISDVSTINGIPYPPPGTGSTISTFQTITATEYISTPDLRVSSINGAELNGTTIIISSINTQSVSTNELQVNLTSVSSIQLRPSVGFNPSLSVDMGLGSLFTNVAGAALGGMNMIVGGIALATGVTAIYQGRQTKTVNLSTFELVNGTTQLQISTLGLDVSTTTRFVSSVNADTPGEEYFISTIIPAGTPLIRSFSDPMNTISSPASSIQAFGQWVALPEGNISSLEFSTITCSTLVAADLVSTLNLEVNNIISTNGISAQYVIGEQLISTPLLFVSSINNDVYPPAQEQLSTFPGSIYVADSIFAANLLSTFNVNVGNVISTNGLSAQYVIGEQLVSTPQLFVSSINGATFGQSTVFISSVEATTISTNNISFNFIDGLSISSPVFANPSYSTVSVTGQITASTFATTKRITCGIGQFDGNTISTNTASTGTLRAGVVNAATLSTGVATISTINGIPRAAYQTPSGFTNTALTTTLQTTALAVASTQVTNAITANILANANITISSATNTLANYYVNLQIGSVMSPSTFISGPPGIGHYTACGITFRTSLAAGTYNVVCWVGAAANGNGQLANVNIWTLPNV